MVKAGVGGGNGFVIADSPGSGGSSVTVNGGTLTDTSGQFFLIGAGDTATMTVRTGGQVTTDSVVEIGDNLFGGSGNSSLTVTGSGSTFTTTGGPVRIGNTNNFGIGSSTGTLSVLSGAQFSAQGNINLGFSPDGGNGITDSITVDGGGSQLSTTTNLRVGFFGTGNLLISGGGKVTDVAGDIAFSSTNATGSFSEFFNATPTNSVGTATVTGARPLWPTTANPVVANNSTSLVAGLGVRTATRTPNIPAAR